MKSATTGLRTLVTATLTLALSLLGALLAPRAHAAPVTVTDPVSGASITLSSAEIAAGERTVFSDTLPLDLGRLAGFRVTIDLLTVAGQPRYRHARQAVLNGADGVVFVADAQADRLPENERSLAELREFATVQGRAYPEFPLVLQYNKTDLPDALPTADLDAALNPDGLPTVRAVALDGTGVVETLRTVMRRVAAGL